MQAHGTSAAGRGRWLREGLAQMVRAFPRDPLLALWQLPEATADDAVGDARQEGQSSAGRGIGQVEIEDPEPGIGVEGVVLTISGILCRACRGSF